MEFSAYHGITASDHQARFNDLVSKGFRMISLSVYGDPSDARYAAVWVKTGGPAWQAFHGRNAAQYQQFFDEWKAKGYYPLLIAATGSASDAIFAGVFEQGNPGPWKARHGISRSDFESECNSAHSNNQILASVAIYNSGSDPRYAAVWRTNSDLARWNFHSVDSGSSYQTWFDAATKLPSRPGYVALTGDHTYVSLFRDDAIGAWQARHGLTSDQYQAEFDAQKKNGLMPICVQGGGSGSDTRYAAIFAKQPQALDRVWTVTGTPVPALAAFDQRMKQAMQSKGVRAAALTLLKDGNVRLSRGYTWAEPGYPITQPNTLFRLASVSKAFASAAIYELLKANKVQANDKVFPMLNLSPLPGQTADNRLNNITVQNLIDHLGGWDATLAGFDPVFSSRTIATAMGLNTFPSKRQMAQYMVGKPLQFTPGVKPNLVDSQGRPRGPYSNFGYVMIGLVVEHVTGKTFTDYLKQSILAPLGIQDVFLGGTQMSQRRANEALAEDPGLGLTALDPNSNQLLPSAYGGFIVETMDSGGGLIASVPAVARLAHHYAAWGAALRAPGSARTGSEPGTRTRVGSRGNGVDYAFAFNTRYNLENVVNPNTGIEYIDQFGSDLEALIDSTMFADAPDAFIPPQMDVNPSIMASE
jgi:CubicO group peptidase (beta-lactamase class C family)